jgi:hypothetical protein
MTTVLTPETKAKLVGRAHAHAEADAIIQGTYERWNGHVKRCFVGCAVRDLTDRDNQPTSWHAEFEHQGFGPLWLAYLGERVFEGMNPEDAARWPVRFAEALPVGASLDGLADRLAVRRLREECLPLSGSWPESVRAQVVAAIEQTIAALEGDRESAAEWSAAESAYAREAYAREADRIVEELVALGAVA